MAVNRRLFIHILIAVLSWALFGYYWSLVAQRRVTPSTIHAIQILLILVLLIWGVTALWIQHNRRRFANRPDRRQRRRSSAPLPDHDQIGQAIVIAEPGEIAGALCVEVHVDEATRTKSFRVVDPSSDEGRGS